MGVLLRGWFVCTTPHSLTGRRSTVRCLVLAFLLIFSKIRNKNTYQNITSVIKTKLEKEAWAESQVSLLNKYLNSAYYLPCPRLYWTGQGSAWLGTCLEKMHDIEKQTRRPATCGAAHSCRLMPTYSFSNLQHT